MSEKIIVLVDGSIYSQSVCEQAAWAARRTGAQVVLLHVLGRREAPKPDLSGSIALGARTALLEKLSALDEQRGKLARERGEAILDDARAIVEGAGVSSISLMLRQGDLVDTVADLEDEAAIIAMGKRGEAADFAKLHLGSNLERVARTIHRPLLVAARAYRPIEKVLIAYDGGSSAMKAVDYVARSPLFSGLAISLLTIATESDEARRRLADAQATLKTGGHEAHATIEQGQADVAISRKVEEGGFDLLVMGAYGHARIRTLIIGSTTTEMMRSCRIPILLFR